MNAIDKRFLLMSYCTNTACRDCVLNRGEDGCVKISALSDRELTEALAKISNRGTEDAVSHPSHYCYSKYEPKDVIRAWSLNFNLGCAVKYIARAGRKDDILQDLKKAKQFLEFEIEALEEERNE